eukprot:7211460-Alexandrium_andersonii.AAC.1
MVGPHSSWHGVFCEGWRASSFSQAVGPPMPCKCHQSSASPRLYFASATSSVLCECASLQDRPRQGAAADLRLHDRPGHEASASVVHGSWIRGRHL